MRVLSIVLICLLAIGCNNQYIEKIRKVGRDNLFENVFKTYIKSHHCRKYSNPRFGNPIFYGMAPGFFNDKRQYQGIMGGDSTLWFNNFYSLYLDKSKVQNVAVPNNDLCDMIEQMLIINTTNPQFVIYGTMGGNDLKKGLNPELVINSAHEFIDLASLRFLGSQRVFIGIHPIVNLIGNDVRLYTNDKIRIYGENRGWCYIDPDVVFSTDILGYPTNSEMYDKIHYDEQIALKIRDLITKKCGVAL